MAGDAYGSYEHLIDSILDEMKCYHEDLPYDRPYGKDYGAPGPMQGLQSLDIWWRPVGAEAESKRSREHFGVCYNAALASGYLGDGLAFGRAYRGGLGKLSLKDQEKVIEKYINDYFTGSTETLADHVRNYS